MLVTLNVFWASSTMLVHLPDPIVAWRELAPEVTVTWVPAVPVTHGPCTPGPMLTVCGDCPGN